MRKYIVFALVTLLLCGPALASKKTVSQAMKAYERKEYNGAINTLQPAFAGISGADKELADLSMGIIMLKNAELHKAFYDASISGNIEYLNLLVNTKSKQKSKLAKLYLGEAYLHKGDTKNAIKYLQLFLKQKGISSEQQDIAKVALGLAYAKAKNSAKAKSTWNSVKGKSDVVQSALLAAEHRSGLKPKYDVKAMYKAFEKAENSSKGVSSRHISNLIYLLTVSKQFDSALMVYNSTNTDSPADRETSKDGKQISFYDIGLLDNIAMLMESASVSHLNDASKSGKFGPTATFYLMDSGVVFADGKRIKNASTKLGANASLPKSLAKLAPVKEKSAEYLSGQKGKATQAWNQIISQSSSDPSMLAEVLNNCVYTNAKCDSALDTAKKVSAKGQGRKFIGVNAAIGRYLLSKGDTKNALEYMELARDKSNKNKISSNDPVLLVSLAEAYRSEKTYNEHLEIFFEMNRYFPAVRQIQEAVQGTYATQQKSAGDVKIF